MGQIISFAIMGPRADYPPTTMPLHTAERFPLLGMTCVEKRALRKALMSPQGAELALGPLEVFADLFAEACLFLSRKLRMVRVSICSAIMNLWSRQ